MAQQEEGWPLGLQPLNVRVGFQPHGPHISRSISFNTSLTSSPSSSDLDTESTGSFFHDKSITLGSLLGVSSIVELSRRSVRKRRPETIKIKKNIHNGRKSWCFSLCPRAHTDVELENHNNTAPLGHFLAVERRAADEHRRSHSHMVYGPDELALDRPDMDWNSLFVNGRVAPPRSSPWPGSDDERRHRGRVDHESGCGVQVLFPCMC